MGPCCTFGLQATGASVLATLRNPSTLVCASPSRETAGADEAVTVALNGQCFEGGAVDATFRFLPPLVPNGSFPSSGAITGGAAVRVLGAGMLDVDARCLFGDEEEDDPKAQERTADLQQSMMEMQVGPCAPRRSIST